MKREILKDISTKFRGQKIIAGVDVGTKMIFLLGKLKRENPGSRNGERNNSWDSADQSQLLEIHKTFFRFAKALHQTYNLFFASMDKKLLLLKVGRPTLANCRHSLKVFQMRRSSNVRSSGAADWRRLLWIF